MSPTRRRTSHWKVQRARKARGWYYTVLWVPVEGPRTYSAGLGYLDHFRAEKARRNAAEAPDPEHLAWKWQLAGGGESVLPVTDEDIKTAIRRWCLDRTQEILDSLFEQWVAEARVERALEVQRLASEGKLGMLTLQEFFDEHWKDLRQIETRGSWESEQTYWRTILAHLGWVQIRNIDESAWLRFLRSKIKRDPEARSGWGPRSQGLARNALRCCLKHAVELRAIDAAPKLRVIKMADAVEREVRPFTAKEIPLLLDAAPTAMHRALFATMIGQGFRPGEAQWLRWEYVYWDDDPPQMEVAGTIRGGKGRGKNKRALRQVYIMPLTARELRVWWEACGCPTTGHCFVYNGAPVKRIGKALKNAARRAGLDPDGTRTFPYMLRHTTATLWALNGVPPVLAKPMFGHSKTSRMLEEAYQKVQSDLVPEEMAKQDLSGLDLTGPHSAADPYDGEG